MIYPLGTLHRHGGEIRSPLVRLSNEEDVVELQAIVSSSWAQIGRPLSRHEHPDNGDQNYLPGAPPAPMARSDAYRICTRPPGHPGTTWTCLGCRWELSSGFNRAVFVAKHQLAQHEDGGDGGLGVKGSHDDNFWLRGSQIKFYVCNLIYFSCSLRWAHLKWISWRRKKNWTAFCYY